MSDEHNFLSLLALTYKTRCCFCQEKIANLFMLHHLFLHLNRFSYKCGQFNNCGAEFPTEYLLEMHFRIKHGTNKKVKALESNNVTKGMNNVYPMYFSKSFHTMLSNGASLLVNRIESLLKDAKISLDKPSVKKNNFFNTKNNNMALVQSKNHTKQESDLSMKSVKRAVTRKNFKKEWRNKKRNMIKCSHCNRNCRSYTSAVDRHTLKHLRDEQNIWTVKCLLCDLTSIYKENLTCYHLKNVHCVDRAEEGVHFIDNTKNYQSLVALKKRL